MDQWGGDKGGDRKETRQLSGQEMLQARTWEEGRGNGERGTDLRARQWGQSTGLDDQWIQGVREAQGEQVNAQVWLVQQVDSRETH